MRDRLIICNDGIQMLHHSVPGRVEQSVVERTRIDEGGVWRSERCTCASTRSNRPCSAAGQQISGPEGYLVAYEIAVGNRTQGQIVIAGLILPTWQQVLGHYELWEGSLTVDAAGADVEASLHVLRALLGQKDLT